MSADNVFVALVFGYPPPPEMIDSRFPAFLQRSSGFLLTIEITAMSFLFGIVIGVALAALRRETSAGGDSSVIGISLRFLSGVVIEGVRALPIAVIILLAFHLPYRLFGLSVPETVLATAAFSIYAGVYLAEIFRAGLRSVNPELRSTGQVLGLKRWQVLLRIELPLIWRHMMPDLIGLAVTVFKDTSTLSIVAVPELSYVGRQMLIGKPGDYALIMFLILVLYWLPASILSALGERQRPMLEAR